MSALVGGCECELHAASHYDWSGDYRVIRFETGRTRTQALASLLNPWRAQRTYRRIMAARPEVVHLLNGEGYPWSLWWARWCRHDGVPLLTTVHDPSPHPGSVIGLLNDRLRGTVLRRSSALHAHTRSGSESLARRGFEGVPIEVIPHGNLASLFLGHACHGIPRERMVLCFGRIEYYKGIDVLLRAAGLLPTEWRVVVAGPGSLDPVSGGLARELGNRVEVLDRYLGESEVAALFQRAGVCVMPYRQATQSSVPLLAASFRVPLVASSLGGLVEDVPAVGGVLVAPEQPEELARAIIEAQGRPTSVPPELEFSALAPRFIRLYRRLARCGEAVGG